jgi:UDP-N-acetyl-D-mannosaminuronate dehydrogenase
VVGFYRTLCDTVVPCPSLETAELAKMLESAFRYVSKALLDELGRHAHALGADLGDVVTAAATQPYGLRATWPPTGMTACAERLPVGLP